MNFWLGVSAIVFALKGIGGSFHSTITRVGLVTYHGPIVGSLICLLLLAFFLTYGTNKDGPALSATPPKKNRWLAFVVVYFSIVTLSISIRARIIHHVPIDVRQADMLPLVTAGLEQVKQGHNPYRPYDLSPSNHQAGYYLPCLWLPYLPFSFLGLDIRWANVLAHLIFYLVLFDLFRRRKIYYWSFEVSAFFLVGLIAMHAFSKMAVSYVTGVHTAGYEIFLSLFVWCVATRRASLASVVVPFLMLSREIAVLLVIPYAGYLLKWDRRQFFRSLATVLGILCLLLVPFLMASGRDVFAAYRFYSHHAVSTPWQDMMKYYSLCGPLKRAGLLSLQLPLQAVGLLLSAITIVRTPHLSALQSLSLGGVTLVTFLLFVSSLWSYVFFEPLMLVYFLLFAQAQVPKSGPKRA